MVLISVSKCSEFVKMRICVQFKKIFKCVKTKVVEMGNDDTIIEKLTKDTKYD